MDGGVISAVPWPIGLRWAGASVALAAEAIWLTSTHEAPNASLAPEWHQLLTVFNHGHHYTAAIIFAAAVALVASADIDRILGILSKQTGYAWLPLAVLHGISLIVFGSFTSHGFGAATDVPALSLTWLAGWTAAGAATVLFWLFAVAPPTAWVGVLKQQWRNLALALAAGMTVWVGGLLVQNLWVPLAAGTLRLSALLLSLIYPEVSYNPMDGMQYGLVGTDALMVEIYPACSGYEGIALVSVFVATYLWIFRKTLSFPQAFILFPIGIVGIWFANVLRVTSLIVVGTSISPEVASHGFHSQAGWIGFTLVTLVLIAIAHRWLSSVTAETGTDSSKSRRPELALLLPLIALMATSMIVAAASAGFSALYPIGVVITGTVLWHYRAAYRALFGSWSWEPFAIGTLVFALWALLVPGNTGESQPLADTLAAWPTWLAAVWILFRILGSILTVPLAEELAFRGYLIRKLVAKDFEQVRPGHFTWFSFIASSLLFGLLHQHLLAGVLAGVAFALALYRRGLVGDAILAHMTSNALIAVAVLAAGRWGFWA